MALSHRLKKLREKPTHVKNRIALTWVAVIGVFIVAGWAMTFNFRGFDLTSARDFFQDSKTYFTQPHNEIFDDSSPAFLAPAATSTATSTEENSSTSTIKLDPVQ